MNLFEGMPDNIKIQTRLYIADTLVAKSEAGIEYDETDYQLMQDEKIRYIVEAKLYERAGDKPSRNGSQVLNWDEICGVNSNALAWEKS